MRKLLKHFTIAREHIITLCLLCTLKCTVVSLKQPHIKNTLDYVSFHRA
jgi:hypothetical protein